MGSLERATTERWAALVLHIFAGNEPQSWIDAGEDEGERWLRAHDVLEHEARARALAARIHELVQSECYAWQSE